MKKKSLNPSILNKYIVNTQPKRTRNTRKRTTGGYFGFEDRNKPKVHLKAHQNPGSNNILDLNQDGLLKNKSSIMKTSSQLFKDQLSKTDLKILEIEKKKKENPNKVYILKEERFERFQVKDIEIEEQDRVTVPHQPGLVHPNRRRQHLDQNVSNRLYNNRKNELFCRDRKMIQSLRQMHPRGTVNLQTNNNEDCHRVYGTEKYQEEQKRAQRMTNLQQKRKAFLSEKRESLVFPNHHHQQQQQRQHEKNTSIIRSKNKGRYHDKMISSDNFHNLIFGDASRFKKKRELRTVPPPIQREFNIISPLSASIVN